MDTTISLHLFPTWTAFPLHRQNSWGGSFDGFSEVSSAFGALDGTAPSAAKFIGGSYDGQDEEVGAFASLDGIPPNIVKFRGGSHDGHALLSGSLSGFNGGTPSASKFHGGSYDGHSQIASRGLGFNGDTASLAKFYGGPHDGFAHLASAFGNLMGVSPTLSKYVGGYDDGYTLSTSGLTYFAGPPDPSKYLGGIDDGYAQLVGPFSNFAGLSPSITKYAGGPGDGYGFEFSEIDISLPVELASFQVAVIPGRGVVRLQWRTESEIDNAYWLVMRRTASDSLRTVTQLRGMGTKASSTEYEWTDRELELDTLYYYRLADVSYNGSITHHDELAVRVDAPDEVELFGNFPNPFNPETSIRFALPRKAEVYLVVYNSLGQQVKVLSSRSFSAGFHTLRWDGTNESGRFVSSGVYLYRLLIRLSDPPQRRIRTGRMMLVR